VAAEDVRLEQVYKEAKVALEELLAGRLSPKDFEIRMQELKGSAQPRSVLKAEPKQTKQ
jgi:hypothetical protein